MDLSCKLLERITFNTRPKCEEIMLIVINKPTYEKKLSPLLQTDDERFKIAIAFLTGFDGIFNVTNKNNKFFFTRSINDDDLSKTTIPPGAYDIESLTNGNKRKFFEE